MLKIAIKIFHHLRFTLLPDIKYLLYLFQKANHNKDYSVVKTFGLPLVHKSGGFFISVHFPQLSSIKYLCRQRKKHH